MRKLTLLIAVSLLSTLSGGCLTARLVQTSNILDVPNTLTARGFRYVQKGITARYELPGIFPAKMERQQLLTQMNIASDAYSRLVAASGGLTPSQTLVNVAVEASFVQKGNEFFMVVSMYADKIEITGAGGVMPAPAAPTPTPTPTPAPAPTPTSDRSQARDRDLVALIRAGIRRALPRGT
jgi:hypothetical protein